MKKLPLISVITVSYNSAPTIKKTIESVIAQSSKNLEYILIDGGSTDDTTTIIKPYIQYFSSYVCEPDKGIYDAMNKGLNKAKGRYVFYLNADDFFHTPDVLSDISTFLVDHPTIDVLTGQVIKDYASMSVIKNSKLTKENLRKGIMPPHQSMFVSRSLLYKLNGFSLAYRYAADFELCCKLLKANAVIYYLPKVIATFSAGGAGSNKSITYQEVCLIIRNYFGTIWATWYWLRKIILEQNVKKGLKLIGWQTLIKKGTKISMLMSND